ncbi:site-specific integrase [Clostridia bacterium]|nr:site-specific integrase [Clostridia bacterium]
MPRRERNIYKRCDGRYEARFIKGYDQDGKAKYGAVYAKTYAEVKEKLENTRTLDLDTQTNGDDSLRETMSAYLVSRRNLLKSSTYGVYERYITNHITSYFGNMTCAKLTQEILQDFADKNFENGLSVITVQSVLSFLKSGLKSKVNNGVFEVELPKKQKHEVEVFSIDEQKRLEITAASSDSIDFLGVILCLYTGLRIGEVCGLMWSDIDFERRLLHVRRTMQRIKGKGVSKTEIVFLPPKSQTSARAIPLPDFLLNILNDHKVKTLCPYILSRDCEPVEPRNLQYRFQKLLNAADVKRVNFHVTRHTFATRALESGCDIKTLSEILGHSSATVTLNRYAHCLDKHKRDCMESLAATIR